MSAAIFLVVDEFASLMVAADPTGPTDPAQLAMTRQLLTITKAIEDDFSAAPATHFRHMSHR